MQFAVSDGPGPGRRNPTPALRGLDAITVPKAPGAGRPVKAFNPIARVDSQLFGVLMSGDHTLHGFTNRDLREKLRHTLDSLSDDPKAKALRSAGCFTGCTSTDSWRRFLALVAGG